jgi:hypothetical protein
MKLTTTRPQLHSLSQARLHLRKAVVREHLIVHRPPARISSSKLDAKNLAVPPNYFAAPGLVPLKKGQLKVVGDGRRRCRDDFRSVV